MTSIVKSLWLLLFTLVICCLIYPLVVWAIGQTFFPFSSNGSMVNGPDGKPVALNRGYGVRRAQVDRAAFDRCAIARLRQPRAIQAFEDPAQPRFIESFAMLQDQHDRLRVIQRTPRKESLDAVHGAGGCANADHQRRLHLTMAVSSRRLAWFIHA